jgi:hypothetical protein
MKWSMERRGGQQVQEREGSEGKESKKRKWREENKWKGRRVEVAKESKYKGK